MWVIKERFSCLFLGKGTLIFSVACHRKSALLNESVFLFVCLFVSMDLICYINAILLWVLIVTEMVYLFM